MNSTAHAQSILSSTMSRALQQTMAQHHAYVENLTEQSIRDGAAVGFVDVEGQGECVAKIDFPIKFVEKPVFSFGLELPDNVWLQWGAFPTYSATVGAWTTEPAEGEPIYAGALIGIVVSGVNRCIVHYRFTGRSLTNAIGASTSVAATL